MLFNSLVSFQPPPYLDPLPDHFFVALLDFVPSKTQSCFGCRGHLRRCNTDKNIGLLENARSLVLLSLSHKIQKTDAQRSSVCVQYTTDYRNVYFHISPHCWRRIFPYPQLSVIEIYQPHYPLMLDHHKRFLHSLGIQI